jgi:hypothetical protein
MISLRRFPASAAVLPTSPSSECSVDGDQENGSQSMSLNLNLKFAALMLSFLLEAAAVISWSSK